MTTKLAGLFALCFCTFALVACGDGTSGEGEGENEGDTTFACEYVTCDSAKGELCWFQRYPTGEAHSATCLAPPTACTSCSCAEDAVDVELDGASNCDSLVSCTQDNEAITVICDNPRI